MDEFGYIWEVFALLIGLAVAEMLGGFAQILKLRARRKGGVDPAAVKVRIGWLVPSLGALVLVDLATFFMLMWSAREVLDMEMATVLGVLLLIGGYYLIASLVFPDEPELWPEFDAYYWLQKRYVVFGMLAINLLASVAIALLGKSPIDPGEAEAAVLADPLLQVASLALLLNYPAFVWLALSRKRRVNLALIWFIVVTQFVYSIAAWHVEGLG